MFIIETKVQLISQCHNKIQQLFQISNLIGRSKRQVGTTGQVVKHLVHAYSRRSDYIIFPTISDHQRIIQFGLGCRKSKMKKSPARVSGFRYHRKEPPSEIFINARRTHFMTLEFFKSI